MPFILSLFTNKYVLAGLGLALIIGSALLYRNHLVGTIENLQKDLTTCQSSRQQLQDQLDNANAYGQDLQRKYDLLSQNVAEKGKTGQKKVDHILKGPAPTSCEDSIKYLKEQSEALE